MLIFSNDIDLPLPVLINYILIRIYNVHVYYINITYIFYIQCTYMIYVHCT